MNIVKLPLIAFNKLINFLPSKVSNRIVCSMENLWTGYFEKAESAIDKQWDEIIWPKISKFDFRSTLDLAPGAGRNIKKLSKVAKEIYAIDYNEYALNLCKKNVGYELNGCKIQYYQNDGSSLRMLGDSSITSVYCWDSAVHFDKLILKEYIKEFSRILSPGGFGFVHHSNLGDQANNDIRKNHGWRSNMTKELFKNYCLDNKLHVISQDDLPWGKVTDCITVFKKTI